MNYSLVISKNFTAHQNKDAQSVPKSWELTVFTVIAKNSLICLMIYILEQRAQHFLVWNNAPPRIRTPPHIRRLSLILSGTSWLVLGWTVPLPYIRAFLENVSRKFKFYWHLIRITILSMQTDKCTFVTISRSFLLNTLRTGFLNCLNARSRGLTFRHLASCI